MALHGGGGGRHGGGQHGGGGGGGGGHHGQAPGRTSHRLDPAVAEGARHADMPDGGIYGRPSTTRISSANLGLSIAVLAFVALLLLAVLLVFSGWFR